MGSLEGIYKLLLGRYGPQGWWPLCVNGEMRYFAADKPNPSQRFEIAVGAILAQNTAWTNAAKAVLSLHSLGLLEPQKILECPGLAKVIRSSGHHNQKAKKLRLFCSYFQDHANLFRAPDMREQLLSIKGIGPETADSIQLYAAGRRAGIGDAYARRILSRYGFRNADTYEGARNLIENELSGGVKEMNDFHALLVEHAKRSCRKNHPLCEGCVLSRKCRKLLPKT